MQPTTNTDRYPTAVLPTPDASRFALILVAYTDEKARAAIRFCDELSQTFDVTDRVLVDNNPQPLLDIRADCAANGWTVLTGSNVLREFSGWQEGLDALAGARAPATHMLLVNDTVVSHRIFTPWRMRALRAALASIDDDRARIVGFTDRADGVFAIDGRSFDRWVSTYCFALSARALDRLDRRLLDLDAAQRYVPGGADERRFLSDRLSEALHFHYHWWLFGGGWYGSEPLNEKNAEAFTLKARCMLLEHLLAVRCNDLGIEIVDPFDRRQSLAFLDRTTRYVGRNVTRIVRSVRSSGPMP